MSGYGLEGKVALVIGASRGIGAATVRALVREGARVVLASRDVPAMQALVAALPAGAQTRIVRADLTVQQELEAAVATAEREFGRLDIACNNGGVSHPRVSFADLTPEVFETSMNTNVRGMFQAMQYEIRAMLRTGGGAIVNTGSISGSVALPGLGAYIASKHALAGLTKAAALDYAARGIRVNLVSPGPVDTRMTQQGALATEQGRRIIESITPMARISAPEEIAEAILWFASPRASYATGAIVPVDGGYTLP